MLNKPKYMIPSTNISECTVDVNASNIIFSCIVDGNEAVFAWRIRVYKLNNGDMVYDTGKITASSSQKSPSLPFYPVNEKNQNVVFSVNLKDYVSVLEDGNSEFVNDVTAYYWTIEFWNNTDNKNDTGANSPTTLSCEEVFYANSTPVVEVLYKTSLDSNYTKFPSDVYDTPVFASTNYYFKANYLQDEGVELKRYGWRITDIKTGQILLDTISANQIYGIAENIVCQYSGFANDNDYSVEVYIETQNGVGFVSDPCTFSVSYPTTPLTLDFVTETLPLESAVMNSWGDSNVAEGKATSDDVGYINRFPIIKDDVWSVNIPENESIIYNYNGTSNLDVSEDSYIVLSMQLPSDNDTLLFLAEGVDVYGNSIIRKLSFTFGKFEYIISDTTGDCLTAYYTPSTDPYFVGRYKWFVIVMAPCGADGNLLTVNEFFACGGLYPSENLYPSESLYPSFGDWKLITNKEAS